MSNNSKTPSSSSSSSTTTSSSGERKPKSDRQHHRYVKKSSSAEKTTTTSSTTSTSSSSTEKTKSNSRSKNHHHSKQSQQPTTTTTTQVEQFNNEELSSSSSSLQDDSSYQEDQSSSIDLPPSGRVCVIGVIGDSSQGKFMFLNKLVNQSVFHKVASPSTNDDNVNLSEEPIKLEIYHDESKENVYINLNSIRDTRLLSMACQELSTLNNSTSNDIEKFFDDADYLYLKYLLFLFNTCNIIFLVFESLTIKLDYFNIFKTLKHMKQMTMPSINNILTKHNIPNDITPFLQPGRCIPILQVFLVKDLTDNYSREYHLKLEENLKKQIITLLKNNSLFTSFSHHVNTFKKDQGGSSSLSSSSLFLIEMNRPLVRLIRLYQIYNQPTSNQLIDEKGKSLSIQKHFRFYTQLMSVYESGYHNIPTACINSFKYSINNHKYKLAEYSLWEKITTSLLGGLFEQKESVLNNLKNYISIDLYFSSKICQSYFKLAIENYLEGLPPIYGSKIHQSKLQKSIQYLTLNSNGPAIDQYTNNLRIECESIWKKGRKLCEAESVTGRVCTLKTHHLPSLGSSGVAKEYSSRGSNTDIETRPHSSGYRSLATCNCGKTIKLREDVFDIEIANSTFFQQECCNQQCTLVDHSQTLLSYHSPITYQHKSYSPTFSWFALLKFASSGLKNLNNSQENFSIPNDGYFVNNESILQDWEMKRIFAIWNNTSSSPNINLQKYETGKLAFEYQCPLGHRFYEKRRSRKFFIENSSSSDLSIFYQKQLLETCTHNECEYMAQLMRVVMIPTVDLSVRPVIEIKHNDKVSSKWEFSLESECQLQNRQSYLLRLPYIYLFENINLLRNQQLQSQQQQQQQQSQQNSSQQQPSSLLYLYFHLKNINQNDQSFE
ncbi:Multicopy Suppressor of STA10-11; Mss11p [Cavenderia fasciculata]|uniref:Nonsense-mediated mRNA decay factor SMG8 n=1 Tax=Cavenderia fasciculata TaxID=261658 RepID=F4PR26_CACFS|nr:Multicopy Suppressor of STA10-11; Mss11p [Cavenderia fasciculata]EGG22083.1 Multicopy Suppressor of STA10-11; Mss11p [Cavenderia fasciculata]|eukprot:XP_004359934.1 Multicopy Suppressor of STA10-11; Mss11p [Cavenderia fasciculata]